MVDRLLEEFNDLRSKRAKLAEFMHTNIFYELNIVHKKLLKKQLIVMDDYLDILEKRIELLG